jgi:hypothetical protein
MNWHEDTHKRRARFQDPNKRLELKVHGYEKME